MVAIYGLFSLGIMIAFLASGGVMLASSIAFNNQVNEYCQAGGAGTSYDMFTGEFSSLFQNILVTINEATALSSKFMCS